MDCKNIDQFGLSSWVSAAISDEIESTVRSFIQETVKIFMEDQRNENILQGLLSEILMEMGVIGSSIQEIYIFEILQGMIDREILISVQNLLLDLSRKNELVVYTMPRVYPKSKTVDKIMDDILNMILVNQIIDYQTIEEIGQYEKAVENILDKTVMKCIMHELATLMNDVS